MIDFDRVLTSTLTTRANKMVTLRGWTYVLWQFPYLWKFSIQDGICQKAES